MKINIRKKIKELEEIEERLKELKNNGGK